MDVSALHTSNLVDECRAWIDARLAATPIEYYPLPHVIVSDFFPDDVYREILANDPFQLIEGREWMSRDAAATLNSATPYWLRKQVKLPEETSQMPVPEQSQFWQRLSEVFLADRWFQDRIVRKFPDYFSLRYGPLVAEDDFAWFFRAEMFLQRHEPNFSLGPHTDIPIRVATCIFSFAEDERFADYGTDFCVPLDRVVRCSGRGHHSSDDFRTVKTAPYRPNNFVLFLKTNHSFHCVKPMPPGIPRGRYGMQYQLWENDATGVLRDITAPASGEDPVFQQRTDRR